jgi:hypothetical protein
VSFDLVFCFFDAILVGGEFKNEQHDQSGQQGDEDQGKPGIHVPEGEKNHFKYFAED